MLLLIFCGPGVEPHADETDVHGEHRPVDGVDVLQLLAYQAQREVVEAVAAVTLREAHARQTERRQLGEDLWVMMPGAVIGRDVGRELAGTEIPDRVDKLLLIGGQPQLKHLSKLLRRARSRAAHRRRRRLGRGSGLR